MPVSVIRRSRTASRQSVAVALAAMCVAAVLAGCGQSVSALRPTPGVTATPAPSATATPLPTPVVTRVDVSGPPVSGKSLIWTHATLPDGFGMAFRQSDLGVAPSDGSVAYSCGVPTGATDTRVVVTRDSGGHWQPAASLPGTWQGCQSVMVDQQDSTHVVVCCAAGGAGGGTEALTLDGGNSWKLMSGTPAPLILAMASRGTRTYAILGQQGGNGAAVLGVSDDGLHTWRPIDSNLHTSGYRALWLDPTSGELLLETWPNGAAFELWSTVDDGANWTRFALPPLDVSFFSVQQKTTNAPWHICSTYLPSTSEPGNAIVCTSDGGRTWTEEPVLSPNGGAPAIVSIAGLAEDGAVLAYDSSNPRSLYRLPPGATRWQTLGHVPSGSSGGVSCVPAEGGAMVVWSFPAESDGAGAPDSATAVYSAVYPY